MQTFQTWPVISTPSLSACPARTRTHVRTHTHKYFILSMTCIHIIYRHRPGDKLKLKVLAAPGAGFTKKKKREKKDKKKNKKRESAQKINGISTDKCHNATRETACFWTSPAVQHFLVLCRAHTALEKSLFSHFHPGKQHLGGGAGLSPRLLRPAESGAGQCFYFSIQPSEECGSKDEWGSRSKQMQTIVVFLSK